MSTSRKRPSAPRLSSPSDRQIRAGVRFVADLPRGLRRALALLLVAVLLVGGVLWLRSHQWSVRSALDSLLNPAGTAVSTGFAGSGVQTYSTASEVLDGLTVADAYTETTYKRDAYGQAWADIDKNGCDQRNDILTRDLTNLEIGTNCYVLSGSLLDPYTAESIDFTRGPKTSEAVPIDHVVALSNAWVSGAWKWSADQRVLLANDPLNLQAAGQAANTEKSDKSADAWLPQPGYRCEYVARQVSVKAAYQLTVTSAEKRAMQGVLATCPDQPAYRSSFTG
ncbi:HNH endonuclease [Rothia nasimurium]|uniref:HNH endonuclease n=1 Tax=Rothia nasimurium TaxID=85336 RepID=A0A4Y9F8U6_9MICC|nr:HNH endonuclease family protein [Rothia nasimurium]MBF0807258.1 HNH endonuclease [Rothia nasimurium]TFU24002.1 HNH endonuclease [Rothia nasimurium]